MSPLDGARISHLMLTVPNLHATRALCLDLGFQQVFGADDCAFLQLPGDPTRLALYRQRPDAADEPQLLIDVPHLDAVIRDLVARGIQVGPPHDVPYGRAAVLTDPNGAWIEFHQPR